MPMQTTTIRVGAALMALFLITAATFSTNTTCDSYMPSSVSSLTSSQFVSARTSRWASPLHASNQRSFGRSTEAERLKRKRDELDAKVLREELLSEVREAELARKKVERDIREAETRRRALNEKASMGRNYIDDLQSGSFGAVNAAKKFLDNSDKTDRSSKLDLERDRLELELEQLKSRQKA